MPNGKFELTVCDPDLAEDPDYDPEVDLPLACLSLAASVGRRISSEVQAYDDRMFALTHASACEGGESRAALSDAA